MGAWFLPRLLIGADRCRYLYFHAPVTFWAGGGGGTVTRVFFSFVISYIYPATFDPNGSQQLLGFFLYI